MNRDIYNIATDYLNGTISENDRRYFLEWLEESPDNKAVFTEIEKVWKLTGILGNTLDPDIDAEWQTFKQLREKKPVISLQEAKPKTISFYALRIAAVLVPTILIISFVFYSNKLKNDEKTWLTIKTTVSPIEHKLPDGSVVFVNNNATITYPKRFSKNERLVKLTGEAYFKVEKKGNPFIIETDNSKVRVLGTRFNIKSIKGFETRVSVDQGSVMFSDALNPQNKIILKPGEMGIYKGNAIPIQKVEISAGNARSWYTQELHFENNSLQQVKTDIATYFDMVVIIPESFNKCLFTGDFQNPEIGNVLKVISLSVGGTYTMKNDTVRFEGNGCN